ncbi:MAG: imidazole glycerol phosphate synthase subunit HisH [Spirochaetia bacterium]|jgi:glutamine amidotransferase
MSARATFVIDYGAGNLKSVENALRHLGARYQVTSRPTDLEEAEAVIFPGVGEAAASMAELTRTGLGNALRAFLASGRKLLGICIGCQVIFDRSEERQTECLGLFPGIVRRFAPGTGLKVPHMGWNPVHFIKAHPVFSGIPQDSSFYFVHSFYPAPADPSLVAAETEYGIRFPACVARGNMIAFQFHLEKSGPVGLRLLSNFLAWNGRWETGRA